MYDACCLIPIADCRHSPIPHPLRP